MALQSRTVSGKPWLLPVAAGLAPLLFSLSTHVWLGSGDARSAAMLVVAAATGGFLLFAPGVAALRLIERRWTVGGTAARLCFAVVAAGALYWFVWWVWVVSPSAGRVLAVGLWVGVVAALWADDPEGRSRTRPLWLALGISVSVAVAMIAILSVHGGIAVAPDTAADGTFATGDNLFPLGWFQRVEDRGDLTAPYYGWPLAERPPAQAAWITPAMSISANDLFAYEVLSAVLQGLAASAVATALLTMGLRRWRTVAALGLATMTVFVFFNTVFVMPKLLAGALLVFVVAALLDEGATLSPAAWAGVGGAVVLSAVAHPGTLFAFPALAVVMLRQHAWPRTRPALLASVGAAAAVALPWVVFQVFVYRGTSLLLKWHLAGISDPNDQRGLWSGIVDQYRAAGFGGWLRHRWENLQTMAGVDYWTTAGSLRQRWLTVGAYAPLWSGGVLIVAAPLAVLRRRYSREVATTLIAASCALVVAAIIEFGPPAAVVASQQVAYADLILLGCGLAALAASVLHRWLLAAMVAVQAMLVVWVLKPIGAGGNCDLTRMCFQQADAVVRSESNVLVWMALVGLAAVAIGTALAYAYATEGVAEHDEPAPVPELSLR